MNITTELKGLESALAGLQKAGGEINARAVDAVNATALDIQREARKNVSVDMGNTRAQIVVESPDVYTRVVRSRAASSAALEFGSKAHWAPFSAILEWVKRKGIGARFSAKSGRRLKATKSDQPNIERAARAIWISISKKGTKAHPFLFPAFEASKGKLVQRLRSALGGAQ